ncbi:MAG TPA: hypothetical protein P5267_02805 [Patescibacteria group bacterium]|nr:hypothetical protein [Patescibacteria group bacterium]
MKKIFFFFILCLAFYLLLAPVHPAQAAFTSLVDEVSLPCMASGDCTPCDVLQVLFNFAKFIFVSMGGLVLLFIMWQASGMIMNWGNAEAIKAATDKMKSTLLAAFIILAAYFLVGALISVYSDNTFKTFIKRQASADWNIGPKCESGKRPEKINDTTGWSGGQSQGSLITNGCKSSWEQGSASGCGGSCGGIKTKPDIRVEQCNDASPELVELLKCIQTKRGDYPLLKDINTVPIMINSISDDHGLGTCRDFYSVQCTSDNADSQNCCYHGRGSCHYGGQNGKTGSYAADFGTLGVDGSQFESLVISGCNGNFRNEGDHYHVSARACSGQ